MKTLLVAVQAEDRDQASAIAAYEFRIYLASSPREALSMLDAVGIDGIVCGVHFNEGNLFEFLRLVRRHPRGASLPLMVVKVLDGRLHPESYRAVEMACEEEGIPYLDAGDLIRQCGTEAGYAKLRERICELLG